MKTIFRLLIIAFGLISSYVLHGFVLEKITKKLYGSNKRKFTFYQTLFGFSTLCYSTLAYVCYYVEQRNEERKLVKLNNNILKGTKEDEITKETTTTKSTPTALYLIASLAYVASNITTLMSLQWVPYTVQIVAKSTKPIPALIFTTLIAKRRYSWKKYLIVLILVTGVSLVLYKDKAHRTSISVWYGEILLLLSLICDGITNGYEEKIRLEHPTSPYALMFTLNGASCLIVFITVIMSGEFIEFVDFVHAFPEVLVGIVLIIIAGSIGQLFIFWCLLQFGAVMLTVVTTVRKCITVLISLLYFGNSLEKHQWVGSGIVLLAIVIDLNFVNLEKHDSDKGEGEDCKKLQEKIGLEVKIVK